SVTWLQDGEPLSQDAQQTGGIFSYENGTYQTWVSTRIPQGQEQGFSCHVGHSGNNSTGLVSCGKPGNPRSGSQPDPSKGVSPVGDLDCDHDNAMGQMIDGPTVHTAESQENPSFLWKEDL
ncbi:hypothetical protein H1C71_025394, partial [Ictidomys tridecemlineatus]